MSPMSPTAQRMPGLRELGKAERTRRILAAARRLITAEGVEGLTMRRLAREAHVSVRTLYNLSLDKDAVLDALIDRYLDEVDEALAAIDSADPLDRAEAVVTYSLDILFSDAAFYRHFHGFILPLQSGAQLRLAFRAQRILETAIEAGVTSGALNGDCPPELLSRQVLLAHVETIRLWAHEVISPDVARAQAVSSLHVCLLAVAEPETREALLQQAAPLREILAAFTPPGTPPGPIA